MTLDEFKSELDVCNLRIQDLFALEPDAAISYAQEVAEYMNQYWKFHRHWFLVVGEWEQPILQILDNEIIHNHQTAPMLGTAKSNGFGVYSASDKTAPLVGLSFITNSIGVSSSSLKAQLEPLAFAEINKVTLQYVRPEGQEVISTDVAEVMSAIQCANDILYTYTNHPNSTFYQQSPKRQERFIRDTLAIVENAMPITETHDVVYVHDSKAKYMYVKDGDKIVEIKPSTSDDYFIVTGQMLGVTLPDIINDGFGRKYESPNDFEAAAMGICMIVDVKTANFKMPPEMGTRVFIPVDGTIFKMAAH